MKFSLSLPVLSVIAIGDAFSPPKCARTVSHLQLQKSDGDSWGRWARQALGTAAVTASLWAAPAFLSPAVPQFAAQSTAVAKEMASGSGSRVNKDPESLLRYGLPIKNKEVRVVTIDASGIVCDERLCIISSSWLLPAEFSHRSLFLAFSQVRKLQVVLEDIKLDIGSKRKAAAESGVRKALSILNSKTADKLKASCRDAKLCDTYITSMKDNLGPLSKALQDSMESFNGSEQERTALDKAYDAQRKVVNTLSSLEEQMIPAGYKTPVPEIYNDLPQLQGRATVEMVLEKADKSTYDVKGSTYSKAKMTMVIDGYTAPVTGGNFVDLVKKGFYNKMPIQRSDGFVVQTGDPDGEADGYTGTGSKSVGNGPHGERLIPLEIFVKGDAGPIYETTIEDEGRGGQASVLPFSSYGAMGWAREEYDPNSGSSQFFWLLFDSDLTPAGKNVLDGR